MYTHVKDPGDQIRMTNSRSPCNADARYHRLARTDGKLRNNRRHGLTFD